MFKHIILVLIFSAIPAFLSYIANSTVFLNKLVEKGIIGKSINLQVVQDYCLWIGMLLSALLLSANLLRTKIRHDYVLEQRNSLIKMEKALLTNSLGKQYLSNSSAADIRIFIPKHQLLYKFADILKIKGVHKKYIIKNIDLIADQGTTKNLQFEVSPESEGLVGICYNQKAMVYDDDLEHTNDTSYSLDRIQVSRTSNLKWSICCPVFDDKNTVVAIIALDGKTKITIDKEKENDLKEELYVFTRMLYDYVPQLFRR